MLDKPLSSSAASVQLDWKETSQQQYALECMLVKITIVCPTHLHFNVDELNKHTCDNLWVARVVASDSW